MSDETGKLFAKARRAIDAAELLLNAGQTDFAAGRSYYAMFYTAAALLVERGSGSAATPAFKRRTASTSPRPRRWTRSTIGGSWTPSTGASWGITALRPS